MSELIMVLKIAGWAVVWTLALVGFVTVWVGFLAYSDHKKMQRLRPSPAVRARMQHDESVRLAALADELEREAYAPLVES